MGCKNVIGKRKKIIESWWRAAGITDAICLGSKPTIDPFHDIERKIGTCVWKQMMKATNRIGSSITETLLMHLKKTWTNISEQEVKKEKCRTFANEHSVSNFSLTSRNQLKKFI